MIASPWSVQVELAEGCTRLCAFCGLNAIRNAPGGFKWLTVAHAQRLAASFAELCPAVRYEFAMHGEPLTNPNAAAIVDVFRTAMPRAQLQLTTNGMPLMGRMQSRLRELFASGLDFVVIDTYREQRARLREEAEGLASDIAVYDFYRDLAPKGWSPWHNHRRRVCRTVVLMDDLGERDGEVRSRVVVNHAGSNPLGRRLAEPLRKTCTNPFREMTVTWNGAVHICCMDWRGELVVGNVLETSARAVWEGERFEAARAVLFSRDRRFAPCSKCDAGSGARAGLLPAYGPPTLRQKEIVCHDDVRLPAR